MKYAIIIYGQYRSFDCNLEKNLEEINTPILRGNIVDIYIITDKSGNYSTQNTNKIISTFKKYNCDVKFVKVWEDLYEYHKYEKENKMNYDKQCKHSYGKHNFTSNLWYRRYVTNKIVNEYMNENNLIYDIHMFMRLFDITIKKNISDFHIKDTIESIVENDKLLMSIDTVFIAPKDILDKVFSFGKCFNIYHDELWNNSKLCNYFKSIDYGLYNLKNKPTYCSEIQIFCHIFNTIDSYENIRYDWNNKNNVNNKSTLFQIRLCNLRHR